MQDLPPFSNCRLRFISGASLLSEAGLQLLLLSFQSLSAGFQSLLLFTPAAMGLGQNLNRLLQRCFLTFDGLLLIAESLLAELSVAFLLQQCITLLTRSLQAGIRLLQFLLQRLPALCITTGFEFGFLRVDLAEFRLQRAQGVVELLKPGAVLLPGLLQFAEFALTLLHPFQQRTVGPFRGLAFRVQSGLTLLQLTKLRSLLVHCLQQPLLLPPAGGEGLSQLQQSLA